MSYDYIQSVDKEDFLRKVEKYSQVMISDDMIRPRENPILGYRGDARPPAEIFFTGFHKKNREIRNPIFKSESGHPKSSSCVCFSRNIQIANLFPEKTKNPINYIYVILSSEYFNTQRMQARIISGYVDPFKKKLTSQMMHKKINKLYRADELCTNFILSENILLGLTILNKQRILMVEANPYANKKYRNEMEQLQQQLSRHNAIDFEAVLSNIPVNHFAENMIEKYQKKALINEKDYSGPQNL